MIVVAMLFGLAAAVPLQPDNGYKNVDEHGPSVSVDSRHFPQVCSDFVFSPGCIRFYVRRVLPFLKICRKLPGSDEEPKAKNSTEDVPQAETIADNLRAVTDCIHALRKVFEFKPNSSPAQNQDTEGRSKRRHHHMMHMAFSMAFSLMSLLVGKAMSLSVMALMAALMNKNDHGGGGHHHKDSVTYDIVQHPQVHYANTHSLEHVYDESSHHPVMYEQPRIIRRIHQKFFSK
ncbi:uncharacterized protein LOC112126541 [Cimex lectularius]|uniref:Uncharacterized protein n=1 Tax=Cimex lectularius TaxID=79782 RepID=A0A8I6SGF3_CIMLE|nr:uncharacterized protein LOC112126541 [Cimex lectularius]